MKRILSFLLCLILVGCSSNTNIIKPFELSNDASKIIDLLGVDGQLFTSKINTTSQRFMRLAYYLYEDGSWTRHLISHGEAVERYNFAINLIGSSKNKIPQNEEYNLRITNFDNNLLSSVTFEQYFNYDLFKDSVCSMSSVLQESIPIDLNKEIILFLKLGTINNFIKDIEYHYMDEIINDHDLAINAGIVITIEYSDTEKVE